MFHSNIFLKSFWFKFQEAKTHRERELKKAEGDLNKIKKKAEESSKDMKDKEQVGVIEFVQALSILVI